MTERVLNLKSPSIVEAVLDIQCDLPPGFDLAVLEESARAAFRAQYRKNLRRRAGTTKVFERT